MPRYVNDGNIKVAWCETIADKTAPTVTELDAGVELHPHLTKDGLNITFAQNAVDDGSLAETFDAQLPGSYSVSIELTMKRRNKEGGDTDEAWALFSNGDTGYLVVRRGSKAEEPWAAGDDAEVYPATAGQKGPTATASNEQARFVVPFYGSETPELDAVVAS